MAYFLANKLNTVSVGWDFFEVPITEGRRRIDYADPSSVDARALRDRFKNARDRGYRLNPETFPKRVRWQTAKKETPDILPDFAVSDRFRQFVESFEPGVHQFVPVEVWRDKTGDRIEQFYWFVVCQRLDSVSREHSTYQLKVSPIDSTIRFWSDHVVDETTREETEIRGARLVFDSARIGSHHIWCDPHILTFGERLCSNAFAEAAEREKFVGLSCSSREEA